ncbi:hypothetical protein HY988_04730 [Candidatus Micrarchaeota archaeon]|nr:hypothetical protein [Candidatus Micrarchaeota archaeon]
MSQKSDILRHVLETKGFKIVTISYDHDMFGTPNMCASIANHAEVSIGKTCCITFVV